MGCSNPHPHGQVWSLSEVPTLPATELASLQRYRSSAIPISDAPKGPQGILPHLLDNRTININVRFRTAVSTVRLRSHGAADCRK